MFDAINVKPKSISTGIQVSPALLEPIPEHPMKRLMMKKLLHEASMGIEPPLMPEEQAEYDFWYAVILAHREEEGDYDNEDY